MKTKYKLIKLFILLGVLISSCDKKNPVNTNNEPIDLVWEAKKLPETELMTLSVSSDGTLYAINAFRSSTATDSDRSLIYVSEDKGETWEVIDMETVNINNLTENQDPIEVFHVEPVGQDRLIILAEVDVPGPIRLLYSENGGDSWSITGDFYVENNALFTSDYEGNVLLACSGKSLSKRYIHQSTDYGQTWNSYLIPENNNVHKAYFGKTKSSIFVNADSLYHSKDGGENWSANRFRFWSLARNSNGTLLGIESFGEPDSDYTIFISSDDGESWEKSNIEYQYDSIAISALSSNSFLLIDEHYNHIVLSEDGANWQKIDSKVSGTDSTLSDFIGSEISLSIITNPNMKIIKGPQNYLYLSSKSRTNYEYAKSYFFMTEEPTQAFAR